MNVREDESGDEEYCREPAQVDKIIARERVAYIMDMSDIEIQSRKYVPMYIQINITYNYHTYTYLCCMYS